MRIIRKQSNKILSQQKLHHNASKHPKMYFFMVEDVWFILEIKNHKQRVNKEQTLLARANKRVNVYLSSLMMKVPDHVYVLG
jgi:hypothetical protein